MATAGQRASRVPLVLLVARVRLAATARLAHGSRHMVVVVALVALSLAWPLVAGAGLAWAALARAARPRAATVAPPALLVARLRAKEFKAPFLFPPHTLPKTAALGVVVSPQRLLLVPVAVVAFAAAEVVRPVEATAQHPLSWPGALVGVAASMQPLVGPL